MSIFAAGSPPSGAQAPRLRNLAAMLIERVSAGLERGLRPRELDCRRLNPRLLADIGASPSEAKETTPLGEVSGRTKVGGLPLFAHRRSPLG